jgi:hypothetical protein
MVERFNGRLQQAPRSHQINIADSLEPRCIETNGSTTSTCHEKPYSTSHPSSPSSAGSNLTRISSANQ